MPVALVHRMGARGKGQPRRMAQQVLDTDRPLGRNGDGLIGRAAGKDAGVGEGSDEFGDRVGQFDQPGLDIALSLTGDMDKPAVPGDGQLHEEQVAPVDMGPEMPVQTVEAPVVKAVVGGGCASGKAESVGHRVLQGMGQEGGRRLSGAGRRAITRRTATRSPEGP